LKKEKKDQRKELLAQSNLRKISAVIPAFNEEKRIGAVINKVKNYVDETLVINDCSSDNTAAVAEKAGAKVISNKINLGYIESIKKGFKHAQGDIIVTLDADGEHRPDEIPILLEPLLDNTADLVLGKRKKIQRISERFLNWLTKFKVKVQDSGTGFKAINKDLALKLVLKGKCICGIFVLEAHSLGAQIAEIPININPVEKKRKIAWHHILQFFFIIYLLINSSCKKSFYYGNQNKQKKQNK